MNWEQTIFDAEYITQRAQLPFEIRNRLNQEPLEIEKDYQEDGSYIVVQI